MSFISSSSTSSCQVLTPINEQCLGDTSEKEGNITPRICVMNKQTNMPTTTCRTPSNEESGTRDALNQFSYIPQGDCGKRIISTNHGSEVSSGTPSPAAVSEKQYTESNSPIISSDVYRHGHKKKEIYLNAEGTHVSRSGYIYSSAMTSISPSIATAGLLFHRTPWARISFASIGPIGGRFSESIESEFDIDSTLFYYHIPDKVPPHVDAVKEYKRGYALSPPKFGMFSDHLLTSPRCEKKPDKLTSGVKNLSYSSKKGRSEHNLSINHFAGSNSINHDKIRKDTTTPIPQTIEQSNKISLNSSQPALIQGGSTSSDNTATPDLRQTEQRIDECPRAPLLRPSIISSSSSDNNYPCRGQPPLYPSIPSVLPTMPSFYSDNKENDRINHNSGIISNNTQFNTSEGIEMSLNSRFWSPEASNRVGFVDFNAISNSRDVPPSLWDRFIPISDSASSEKKDSRLRGRCGRWGCTYCHPNSSEVIKKYPQVRTMSANTPEKLKELREGYRFSLLPSVRLPMRKQRSSSTGRIHLAGVGLSKDVDNSFLLPASNDVNIFELKSPPSIELWCPFSSSKRKTHSTYTRVPVLLPQLLCSVTRMTFNCYILISYDCHSAIESVQQIIRNNPTPEDKDKVNTNKQEPIYTNKQEPIYTNKQRMSYSAPAGCTETELSPNDGRLLRESLLSSYIDSSFPNLTRMFTSVRPAYTPTIHELLGRVRSDTTFPRAGLVDSNNTMGSSSINFFDNEYRNFHFLDSSLLTPIQSTDNSLTRETVPSPQGEKDENDKII